MIKFEFTSRTPIITKGGEKHGFRTLELGTEPAFEPDITIDAETVEERTTGLPVCRVFLRRADGKRAVGFLSVSIKDGKPVFRVTAKVNGEKDEIQKMVFASWRD